MPESDYTIFLPFYDGHYVSIHGAIKFCPVLVGGLATLQV